MSSRPVTIVYQLAGGSSADDRLAVLERVRHWQHVSSANEMFPGDEDESLRQMCYVTLTPESDAAAVISELKALPGVVRAEQASDRGLA